MIKRMILKLGKIGKLITSVPILLHLPYVFTEQGVAIFCGRKK